MSNVEEIPIKDAVQTQKYNFSCDDVIELYKENRNFFKINKGLKRNVLKI